MVALSSGLAPSSGGGRRGKRGPSALVQGAATTAAVLGVCLAPAPAPAHEHHHHLASRHSEARHEEASRHREASRHEEAGHEVSKHEDARSAAPDPKSTSTDPKSTSSTATDTSSTDAKSADTKSSESKSKKHAAGKADAKADRPEKLPSGPLLLAISIGGQRVTVYDNGQPVASSQISTGMSGHLTPTGIFSIIQKQKWHHSNLYSNAPMPYMQRITWSGVALHAGVVPGYPASHGCIRLPSGFAMRLYGMTKVGARVVVGHGYMAPYLIEHPSLTALATKPPEAEPPPPARPDGAPDGAKADGAATLSTGAVIVAATGAVSDDSSHRELPDPVTSGRAQNEDPAAGDGPPGDAPPPPAARPAGEDALAKPGQLSLFVSRREGKLYVRKGFLPAFEVPVTITNPEKPLGNHIFTAAGRRASEGGGIRWLGVSLGYDRPSAKDKKHKAHAEPQAPRAMSGAALRQSALDALDRIELPAEAVARLSPLVHPGTALTISDHGLGSETGTETDFIVVTQ